MLASCVYIYVHSYSSSFMYFYVCLCMCICIYIYIKLHIHLPSQFVLPVSANPLAAFVACDMVLNNFPTIPWYSTAPCGLPFVEDLLVVSRFYVQFGHSEIYLHLGLVQVSPTALEPISCGPCSFGLRPRPSKPKGSTYFIPRP